jgi:hypothetical protein
MARDGRRGTDEALGVRDGKRWTSWPGVLRCPIQGDMGEVATPPASSTLCFAGPATPCWPRDTAAQVSRRRADYGNQTGELVVAALCDIDGDEAISARRNRAGEGLGNGRQMGLVSSVCSRLLTHQMLARETSSRTLELKLVDAECAAMMRRFAGFHRLRA